MTNDLILIGVGFVAGLIVGAVVLWCYLSWLFGVDYHDEF